MGRDAIFSEWCVYVVKSQEQLFSQIFIEYEIKNELLCADVVLKDNP